MQKYQVSIAAYRIKIVSVLNSLQEEKTKIDKFYDT